MVLVGSVFGVLAALVPIAMAFKAITTGRWFLIAGFIAVMVLSLYFLRDSPVSYVLEVARVCLLLMVYPVALVVLLPQRWLATRVWVHQLRWLDSPLIAPVLTPVLLAAFFFTGVWTVILGNAGWYAASYPILIIVGIAIHVGLVGVKRSHSSNMFAVFFFFGMIELFLDSIPGIVMMLKSDLLNASYWLTASPVGTTMDVLLLQQRTAGGLMLVIADAMDLPVLGIIIVRWVAADAREAREMDALLLPMESTQVTPPAVSPPSPQC